MADIKSIIEQINRLEQNRKYPEALTLAQKAMQEHPGQRSLGMRVGYLLLTCKHPHQALGLFKSLHDEDKKNQKSDLMVLIGLGRSLHQSEQYKAAKDLFAQLVQKAGKSPEVQVGWAQSLEHAGQKDEAEKHARLALKIDPQHKRAKHVLAKVLVDKRQHDEAIELLEENITRSDFHSDSIDLWINTLQGLERNRYAQDKLESLVKQHPNTLEFLYGYAVLANRAGETSLARPAFDRAIALSPNNPRIYYDVGVMERIAGNLERSQQMIAKALELKPDNPAALRTFGADTKYEYGDENYSRLHYVAANFTAFNSMEQVNLHYALAKAAEDVGDLKTAFRHYGIGGEKKRKTMNYNERQAARLYDIIPKVVTPKSLADAGQRGCESDVPVFILGMPRSGTSLMEQILSAHPDIYGAGELKYLTGILENITVGQGARLRMGEKEPVFPYDDNAPWSLRGERYVERIQKLADRPDYKRIVDKMPGNFNFVGLIHAILPHAKIIHSRRHPVETCLSAYRIHFAEGHHWSYRMRELGRYYKRYWALMQHWREAFPGVMYEVRYEDNVADVEGSAKKLIEYLGLPWDENCLNFYNSDRPVKTASVTQVRKPIYKTSTNRWRKYEKYLGPLLDELGDIVPQYEAEIEHLMEK
jgi:predicted Zn-dependent protease